MKKYPLVLTVFIIAILIFGFSRAMAQTTPEPQSGVLAAAIGSGITYQGYLEDVDGNEIRYVYNRVVIADMNNDGLLDVVCASTLDQGTNFGSEVFLHLNIGTAEEPVFAVSEILHHVDGSALRSDYAIRIGITDFDGDGVKDLLYNSGHHYRGKIVLLRGVLP